MSARLRFWVEKQLVEYNLTPAALFLRCFIAVHGHPVNHDDVEADARDFIRNARIPPYVLRYYLEGGHDA